MPTWDDLSNIDYYLDEVIALSGDYTVMLKLHHNTDSLEGERKKKINHRVHCYRTNDDVLGLISESDTVISDYSGTIFDAVYFKKPTILLNNKNHYDNDSLKMDKFNVECALRPHSGYKVNDPKELLCAVQYALNNKGYSSKIHSSLRNELLFDNGNAIELAIKTIRELRSRSYKLNQQQLYMRVTAKDLLATKRRLSIALEK